MLNKTLLILIPRHGRKTIVWKEKDKLKIRVVKIDNLRVISGERTSDR